MACHPEQFENMEDLLIIPGVFDRLVEAKILASVSPPMVPNTSVQTITPTQPVMVVPQVPELNAPSINSSFEASSKNEGKWLWILLVGGIAAYVFRYEIGYYITGKPNRKYPRY
jgi:hypothetical protein